MLIPFIPLNLKPEKTTVLLGPISRSERERKKNFFLAKKLISN